MARSERRHEQSRMAARIRRARLLRISTCSCRLGGWFSGQQAGPIDGAAEAIGHAEKQHAVGRDHDDRTYRHLQIVENGVALHGADPSCAGRTEANPRAGSLSLGQAIASVDHDELARDIGGLARGEEGDDRCDFLGRAAAADRRGASRFGFDSGL